MFESLAKKLKTLRCKLIGHNWKYNFSTLPNKAICSKCFAKSKLNLNNLNWEIVSEFEGEKRTNKELINKWF
jgi:urease accessory protein UreH